jgi:hypothetical protein
MKLLIIAGPYEADRIRRAAVSAGFETVAVEPGESLSGWITASRPEVIVMAPQMVHPDPAQALAKVRSVPRGRVPIFLVGDAADEVRMSGLSEGFFVRPVSAGELLARARALLAQGQAARGRSRTAEGLAPAPAVANEFARSGSTSKSGVHARPASLKPLVSASAGPTAAPRGSAANELLAELDAGIDALLDAELGQVVASTTAIDIPAVPEEEPIAAPAVEPRNGQPVASAVVVAPNGEGSNGQTRVDLVDAVRDESPAEPAGDARARLLARCALVDEGDYFEVLGIDRGATAADVRRAHERIAREIGPDAIDATLAGELGPRLDAVRIVVAEAARVLGDDRLRARYAAALSEG